MERTPFITDIFNHSPNPKTKKIEKQIFGLELDCYPTISTPFSFNNENNSNSFLFKENAILLPQTIPKTIPSFSQKNRKISITKKDLETLNNRHWISDEVINSYFNYLHNSYPDSTIGFTNTFFYESLKRNGNKDANKWSGIHGYRLDNFSHFLIPITTGAHWILIDLDFDNRFLNVYDSYMKHYQSIVKDIVSFLDYQGISPMTITFPSVPHQTTSYDCGMFLLKFATMIYEDQPITEKSFTQNDLIPFRKDVKNILSNYLEE